MTLLPTIDATNFRLKSALSHPFTALYCSFSLSHAQSPMLSVIAELFAFCRITACVQCYWSISFSILSCPWGNFVEPQYFLGFNFFLSSETFSTAALLIIYNLSHEIKDEHHSWRIFNNCKG